MREFLERQGNLWGARRDVIDRAVQAASESLEILFSHGLAKGNMELGARFDEFNLDVFVVYQGEKLEAPTERPSIEAILEDEQQLANLAGYMIRRYVDRLSQSAEGARRKLTLHFEH